MHGRLQITPAQELERVCYIDYDSVRIRSDVFPTISRLHLETGNRLVEEERQGIVVLSLIRDEFIRCEW